MSIVYTFKVIVLSSFGTLCWQAVFVLGVLPLIYLGTILYSDASL